MNRGQGKKEPHRPVTPRQKKGFSSDSTSEKREACRVSIPRGARAADRFHISHHLRERSRLDAQDADVQGAGWWQSTSYRVRCIEPRNEMIAK